MSNGSDICVVVSLDIAAGLGMAPHSSKVFNFKQVALCCKEVSKSCAPLSVRIFA